jgi:hypothetical protein
MAFLQELWGISPPETNNTHFTNVITLLVAAVNLKLQTVGLLAELHNTVKLQSARRGRC